jgi:tetratricopeptide (TPR) repeat protein
MDQRRRDKMHWVLLFTALNFTLEPPQQALALNQRGLAAWNRGQYEEAERNYRGALYIWRKLGSNFELHMVLTSMNLGQALCWEGKTSEGNRIFSDALAISRRLGPKDLRTINLMNMLGDIAMVQGDDVRARSVFEEALAIERKLYPNSIELVHTLNGLAGLSLRQRDTAAALPRAEEALSLVLRLGGENGTDIAATYGLVATIHRFAGRPERALPLFRSARTLMEKSGHSGSPHYASVLAEEALALMDDGQPLAAEKNLIRATGILAECAGCRGQFEVAEADLRYVRARLGRSGTKAAGNKRADRASASAPPDPR